MGKIADAVVFTLFSGSLFAIGFARGLTNVRNKESPPSQKAPSFSSQQHLSTSVESGEVLAMKALKKATVYSVVGCSLLGLLGFLFFKSLNIQTPSSKAKRGKVAELDELRALIIKKDE